MNTTHLLICVEKKKDKKYGRSLFVQPKRRRQKEKGYGNKPKISGVQGRQSLHPAGDLDSRLMHSHAGVWERLQNDDCSMALLFFCFWLTQIPVCLIKQIYMFLFYQ